MEMKEDWGGPVGPGLTRFRFSDLVELGGVPLDGTYNQWSGDHGAEGGI